MFCLRDIPGFATPSTAAAGLTGSTARVSFATIGAGWTTTGIIAVIPRFAAPYSTSVRVRNGLPSNRSRSVLTGC